MKMKSLELIVVFIASISCCLCAPTTFSFSGNIQSSQPNVGQWGGVQLNNDYTCGVYETDPSYYYNYLAFNFTIDDTNSSFYFVTGQGFNGMYSFYAIANIYTDFNPNSPCNNLYGNGQFASHELTQDVSIYDGINLVPGTYTVVISASYTDIIWALKFSPADVVLDIQPGGSTFLGPPFYSLGASNNCSVSNGERVYNTYHWIQSTDGWFDIYGIVINSTEINPSTFQEKQIWLSLYEGSRDNVTSFEGNPCQPNFLGGGHSQTSIGGIDYVWLSAGGNYTIVTAIDDIFGKVAIQIVSSTLNFISPNPPFIPPAFGTTSEADCAPADSSYSSPWFEKSFTLTNEVTIVVTTEALYQEQYGSFYIQSYLYSGNNNDTPPSTCLDLLQLGNFETNGAYGSIGEDYTIVVTDGQQNSLNIPHENAGFHLYFLSGTFVNTADFVFVPLSLSTSTTGTPIETDTTTVSTTTSATTSDTASFATTTSVEGTTTGSSSGFFGTTSTTGDESALTSTTGNDSSASTSTSLLPTTTSSESIETTTTTGSITTTSNGDSLETTTTSGETFTTTSSSSSTTNEISETTTSDSSSSLSTTTTGNTESTSTTSVSSSTSTSSSSITSSSASEGTTTSGETTLSSSSSTSTSLLPSSTSNDGIETTTTSNLEQSTTASSSSTTASNSGLVTTSTSSVRPSTSTTNNHLQTTTTTQKTTSLSTSASLGTSTTAHGFNVTTLQPASTTSNLAYSVSEDTTQLNTTQLTFIIFGSMLGFAVIIFAIYITVKKKMEKAKAKPDTKYIEMQDIAVH
eukprot:TRINITY_DN6430_c0_g1_i1.p1 TRINITY_DN6430_c0_g1~~TRINITY_DN6430_c0_g1_i1.p1  ORF type:complete len:799 (-),score=173.90 TRINITY_DN6430_c0_g1_i1:149-2545(-)